MTFGQELQVRRALYIFIVWIMIAGFAINARAKAKDLVDWTVVVTEQGGPQKVDRAYVMTGEGIVLHRDGSDRRTCRVSLDGALVSSVLSVQNDIAPLPDPKNGIVYRGLRWHEDIRIDIRLFVNQEKHVFRYPESREVPDWLNLYRKSISAHVVKLCPIN